MASGGFIFGCEGPRITDWERGFFRDSDPWGFIVFERNLVEPAQIRALTSELRDSVGRDAPVFIDQEGGRVQRLWPPEWSGWEPPLDLVARTGDAAPAALAAMYRTIAAELRGLGIDGNCAPVGDIATAETHPVLRNRCLGTDPGQVIRAAGAVSGALLDGGVLPVVKHMPGHGRATVDSHLGLPRVTADADSLRKSDFKVFQALSHVPLGMTAHVVYSAFTEEPATLSGDMIALIRGEIGFRGLLMTDDIAMGALPGPIGERATRARAAGCDIVLHCNGEPAEMEAVAATGVMTAEAAGRAETAILARRPPGFVDIAAARADFEAIVRSAQ